MKAILRRGIFTAMIDIPDPSPTINLPIVEALNMATSASDTLATSQVWRFRLRSRFDRDIYLYEYEGDS